MNWLFRRHFWIVHLMLLSITVSIMAKTLSELAGYWASKNIMEKPVMEQQPSRSIAKTEKNYLAANERNLFGAKREVISLSELEEEGADEHPGRWQDALPSSLPLKLVSTMIFKNPFASRAVIQDLSSDSSAVYSIGECEEYEKKHSSMIETVLPQEDWEPERPCNNINGMATLVRVEEFRVYILNERDRRFEYLAISGEEHRLKKMVEMPEGIEEDMGIRKIGATSYEIDQSEFDKALANISRLMTEARAVPESDASGAVIGFRVLYVKDGSLFEKIGISEKDIITRINGYELSGIEKALELFSKLKTADRFTIDLMRDNRPVTFDYTVH